MCECGCVANDRKYLFPAPGNKVYMLTLSSGCVECDAPSGVTIERLSKSDLHYRQREDYTNGDLQFEPWPYDTEGVAIVTGMLRHEFVKALTPHIAGIDAESFDDDTGKLDEIGAEIILEEAYDASVTRPRIVEPEMAKAKGR